MMLSDFLNVDIPNPVYAPDSIHDFKHKIFCNLTRKRRRSKGELVKVYKWADSYVSEFNDPVLNPLIWE